MFRERTGLIDRLRFTAKDSFQYPHEGYAKDTKEIQRNKPVANSGHRRRMRRSLKMLRYSLLPILFANLFQFSAVTYGATPALIDLSEYEKTCLAIGFNPNVA